MIKLILCIALDIIDFVSPPGIETIIDLISGVTAILMFGTKGIIMFWELFEITGVADKFVPTMTLIYIYNKINNKQKNTNPQITL